MDSDPARMTGFFGFSLSLSSTKGRVARGFFTLFGSIGNGCFCVKAATCNEMARKFNRLVFYCQVSFFPT